MDDDLHDIDKLFYDGLESKLQPPTTDVWLKINAALNQVADKKRTAYLKPKRMLLLAVLLLFILTGIIEYVSFSHDKATKEKNIVEGFKPHQQLTPPTVKTENSTNKTIPKAFKKQDINNININTKTNVLDGTIQHDSISMSTTTIEKKNAISKKIISNSIYKKHQQINSTIVAKNGSSNKIFLSGHKKTYLSQQSTLAIATGKNNQPNIHLEMARASQIEGRNLLLNSTVKNDLITPETKQIEAANIPNIHLNPLHTSLLLSQINLSKSSKAKSTVRLKTPGSRWYVSLFGAQEWQGYQLQDNDDHQRQQNNENDKNSIKHREDEDPSPAAGINIGYQLNKKISIETGIRYGGYHIRTDSAKIYAVNNAGNVEYKLITSSGYAFLNGVGGSLPTVGDSITAQKVKQDITYIGIPFSLRYKLGNGKLSFNPALGMVLNFITTSTVSASLNNGLGNDANKRLNLSGLTNFSAVIMFNPSISYKASNKIAVGIEPYFNYNISPINNSNVVKSYPYGLGLGAGVKYNF